MKITLATKITITRVLLVIPFMYAALQNTTGYALGALVLFAVASFTDYLDGAIARKMNEVTTLGKFIDQLADKVLIDAALLVFLQRGDIQSWFVITVISRDIAVSGLRMMAATKMKVIAANMWGKVKTVSQMVLVFTFLLGRVFPVFEKMEIPFLWIAFVFTVWSGVVYFMRNLEVFQE